MGKKPEAGTPKALSNAMKSKGMQKLRFFCQLCQKQCRDENGFKCHLMSEGHQRQMLLCADDPGHLNRVTSEFSADFLGGFLQILRLSYAGQRVSANKVYQDYISDRNHTHMNATRWHTLSGFVQWLGKTGYCKIDFVEEKNQWFLEYVDNSPETLQRKAEQEKLKKARKDDMERQQDAIAEMVERGKQREVEKGLVKTESVATELKRSESDAPIKVNLGLKKLTPNSASAYQNPFDSLKRKAIENAIEKRKTIKQEPAKMSMMEQIRRAEQSMKRPKLEPGVKEEPDIKKEPGIKQEPTVKQEPVEKGAEEKWIHKSIVVKVLNKKLGDSFYKQKGFIQKTEDFMAVVKMIESGKRAKIDQEDLDTVIPSVGREVVILVGKYRGEVATLKEIHQSKFKATVKFGDKYRDFPYEHISKYYSNEK